MVVLDATTYRTIVHDIRCYEGLSKGCKDFIETKHPNIPAFTLGSILSTQWQLRMKRTYRKNPNINEKYYEMYKKRKDDGENPGILLRLSVELIIAPSLLASSILEHTYFADGDRNHINSAKQAIKDTTLIKDREFAYEVYLCSLYDIDYGSFGNAIKQSIGKEYEQKLEFELNALNISFIDENVLRSKGYDKTPDFKLILPIAVDGFVINWIESKALFGDDAIHAGYLKDQLLCYWNRFGPGLVIYWFGYLDVLQSSAENNTMIILRDGFPDRKSLTFMNPGSIDDS
ncbi:CDAN1-interacting nuclease 1 [Arctopsyche grandis]|uniref:CDAN1-interacting nuclease 1 n=1 Tax=Arctopsyche grandis TaxID=121162 RepID=UPI00406D8E7B